MPGTCCILFHYPHFKLMFMSVKAALWVDIGIITPSMKFGHTHSLRLCDLSVSFTQNSIVVSENLWEQRKQHEMSDFSCLFPTHILKWDSQKFRRNSCILYETFTYIHTHSRCMYMSNKTRFSWFVQQIIEWIYGRHFPYNHGHGDSGHFIRHILGT